MALPPNSPFRGVAAVLSQPASEAGAELSQLSEGVRIYNSQYNIQYRDSANDQDVTEALYRWDMRSYEEIFRTGFTPLPPTSDEHDVSDYYNFEKFVNSGEMIDLPENRSVFVSTTRSTSWRPLLSSSGTIYRYQIYAPGGIDAVLTLGDQNQHPNQQVIAFVGGIRPQYIRIARPYSVTLTPDSQDPTYTPLGNSLYRNGRFNPNPTSDGQTTQDFMNCLRNPACPTSGEDLINVIYAGDKVDDQENYNVDVQENYVDQVCRVEHYIDSAFNSSVGEEAYLFMADRYLLINYAPGTTADYIIKGPETVSDGFPCLKDTIFANGIDASFTSSRRNEAYIFRSNICALINFAPHDYIIQEPKKISDSFSSLKNTIFENGIDAAFTSSRKNESYIFKGNQYALINFAPGTTSNHIIQGPQKITENFPSLKNTIFEDGIDAAFASSRKNEAYIFKGDIYALIDFAPRTRRSYIIQGPKKITLSFYCLKDIIPMYPCGC